MALSELSSFTLAPITVLDLWVTPDGTPVSATFSATKSTLDGVQLIDIEVSYTFSDVGVPQTIDVPGPGWSPSPSASP
jgi:hypothetical protein